MHCTLSLLSLHWIKLWKDGWVDGRTVGDNGQTDERTINRSRQTMMTSSNGNIFRLTVPLCGEFTSSPHNDTRSSAHTVLTTGWCMGFSNYIWFSVISYTLSLIGETHPGPWFNIKMTSYQYRKSHCGDKTVIRSSYLHNGISYTGKMSSLYWISPQFPREHWGSRPLGCDLKWAPVRDGNVFHIFVVSESFRFVIIASGTKVA